MNGSFRLAFVGVVTAAVTVMASYVAQVLLGAQGLGGSVLGFLDGIPGVTAGSIVVVTLLAFVGSQEGIRELSNVSHHAFEGDAVLERGHEGTIQLLIGTDGGLQTNVGVVHSERYCAGEGLGLKVELVSKLIN